MILRPLQLSISSTFVLHMIKNLIMNLIIFPHDKFHTSYDSIMLNAFDKEPDLRHVFLFLQLRSVESNHDLFSDSTPRIHQVMILLYHVVLYQCIPRKMGYTTWGIRGPSRTRCHQTSERWNLWQGVVGSVAKERRVQLTAELMGLNIAIEHGHFQWLNC